MNIVWLSWKDHAHPARGGAEVVKAEFARRLVRDGHQLVIITAQYPGSESATTHDGYQIIRVGGRHSVYWQAMRYYTKHLKGWADVVIDEVNTIPFFAKFYAGAPTVLLIHQLARQIWFYEMPMPLNLIGYLLEPLYLRLISSMQAITVSESSQKDLMRHGFNKSRIHIIPEGLHIQPVKNLATTPKAARPTLLIHGSLRAMKRPLDVVQAFEIAKKDLPDLRLDISGKPFGTYGQKVADYIARSPYAKDITLHGRTTDAAKIRLMRRAHYIVVTSVKEGWGLIVSESASQGTPAIVYDVDGLRDAVGFGRYGLVAPMQNSKSLAATILRGFESQLHYDRMRKDAYHFACTLTFDAAYRAFCKILKLSHNSS